MASIKQLRIELFGRVQGVNFRVNLAKQAELLQVVGYVESLRSGSVVILAQGKKKNLEELLTWCQHQVFPAKVTGMSYQWEQLTEEYTEFEVRTRTPFIRDRARSIVNLSKEVLGLTQPASVPKHVVIIPDGNRRWAREQGWKPWVGHRAASSVERVVALFEKCKHLGIQYLTFWAFSTENWSRDKGEVDFLMHLFVKRAKEFKGMLMKEQVRFRHFGRKDRLPEKLLASISDLEDATKDFTALHFQICIDYGGRNEIVRAVNKILKDGVHEVTEELVSEYLDSTSIPDPDFIIRTSGEKRTSGIMPYQAVYAELYFTDVYFPDFDAEQFHRAILEYSARTRRFGGTAQADLKQVQVEQLVDPELQR